MERHAAVATAAPALRIVTYAKDFGEKYVAAVADVTGAEYTVVDLLGSDLGRITFCCHCPTVCAHTRHVQADRDHGAVEPRAARTRS